MLLYDDIGAAATGRREPQSNGFRTACPAHGGDGMSLSILRGNDGGAVIRCHSRGCSYGDIVEAFGIDRPPRDAARPAAVAHPPGDRVDVYRSAGGEPVLAIAHTDAVGGEATRIAQWRPTASGMWEPGGATGSVPLLCASGSAPSGGAQTK